MRAFASKADINGQHTNGYVYLLKVINFKRHNMYVCKNYKTTSSKLLNA